MHFKQKGKFAKVEVVKKKKKAYYIKEQHWVFSVATMEWLEREGPVEKCANMPCTQETYLMSTLGRKTAATNSPMATIMYH